MLQQNGLMNTLDCAETLEDLVALVQRHLQSWCAQVTRVTDDRQLVLAYAGRPLPNCNSGPTTLDYSICQHSVAMDFPLVIDDAYSHPLMRGNRAVSEIGIGAYIGVPMHVQRGKATGAICAIELHQRRWTDDNLRLMTDCAGIADRLVAKQK